MPPTPLPPHMPARPLLPWILASALVAVVLQWSSHSGRDGSAMAQLGTGAGARGVFAFSGPLTRNSFGVFMVDVDTSTIWAYEYDPAKQCLRLAAGRSWQYDRYLEQFSACDLPPERVRELVEQEKDAKLRALEEKSAPPISPTPPDGD